MKKTLSILFGTLFVIGAIGVGTISEAQAGELVTICITNNGGSHQVDVNATAAQNLYDKGMAEFGACPTP